MEAPHFDFDEKSLQVNNISWFCLAGLENLLEKTCFGKSVAFCSERKR